MVNDYGETPYILKSAIKNRYSHLILYNIFI